MSIVEEILCSHYQNNEMKEATEDGVRGTMNSWWLTNSHEK